MGGSITWYSKPTYSASEVGALSSAYSNRLTKITSNGIYTGTIDAEQVNTIGVYAERIYDLDCSGNYMEIGGGSNFLDMTLYKEGTGGRFENL